ncbi:MAG: geranylgeranylglyceryl/heptaprenylglyceryl phosphate synthase [Saprospiraceae bacterium]|nr:geranylgeranylglyceryl/heptaprenylglyceryl phosphate synthase [Saprospiraceae bacterium]
MVNNSIYSGFLEAKKQGSKKFAVLIDPDKMRIPNIHIVIEKCMEAGVDYFFIGGSLIVNDMLDFVIASMKEICSIPIILFPGNSFQLSYKADGILFLSLISGRNAELLIGNHVISAPYLRLSPLEIISTGYILVEGGTMTSVQYMSNTYPIPSNKDDIAVCTAMAGEMLGMKQIYLDAGSGAKLPVSTSMISAVSGGIEIPLIVGGGISTAEVASASAKAGADILVVGNAIEKDSSLIKEISCAIHEQSIYLHSPAIR